MTSRYKFALSPIQWYASASGHLDRTKGPSRSEIFALMKKAGFDATVARVAPPERPDETVAEFKALLDEAGLAPAPGYFNVAAPEDPEPLADVVEAAKAAAARQAELGLKNMFIANGGASTNPFRASRPAIGNGFEQGRLEEMTERIGRCAEAMNSVGIHPALHPHVGTWIETEQEARYVLDSIDASVLGFGPDTGHLSWVGADLAALFTDYRDRILAMHLKDIRLDIRDKSREEGKSYGETALAGLWAEPGLGNVDMAKYVTMLGDNFGGWVVVEVDRPTMDPYESAQVSGKWVRELNL